MCFNLADSQHKAQNQQLHFREHLRIVILTDTKSVSLQRGIFFPYLYTYVRTRVIITVKNK